MTKTELRKFIKDKKAQLLLFADAQASGRFTREEQKEYEDAYRFINPKVNLCFTCGRSAQLMGKTLLNWEKNNQPKKRKK